MIVVKLMGGLGNQMFQYACAKRIAEVNSVPLKLDISDFSRKSERPYALFHLNISGEIASIADIQRFKRASFIRKCLHLTRVASTPHRAYRVIRERFFHFDQSILLLSDDAYLEGYWQSERYFSDIKDTIRAEFSFKHQPDSENKRTAGEIIDNNSVSLHVRRGDYISDPKVNQIHGICTMDYYHRAVERILDSVQRPHFFVFSDDPEWVRNDFRLNHRVTYVTHNSGERSFEDLRLMSLCRHNIIANSSFSWWAAWLNSNPDKLVVAPRRWFNRDDIDTEDLIPDTWIRLE